MSESHQHQYGYVPAVFPLIPPTPYQLPLLVIYTITSSLSGMQLSFITIWRLTDRLTFKSMFYSHIRFIPGSLLTVCAAHVAFYLVVNNIHFSYWVLSISRRRTKILSDKIRELLLWGMVGVLVTHTLISVKIAWLLPDSQMYPWCDIEGALIIFFGALALSYATCIAMNAFDMWILENPPERYPIGYYHILSWSIASLSVIFASYDGAQSYFLNWAGWCCISGGRRVAAMVFVCFLLAVNITLAAIVVRKVHKIVRRLHDTTASDSNSQIQHNHNHHRTSIAMESRIVFLLVTSMGLGFIFHVALYINEWIDKTRPMTFLFFLDSLFSYSSGTLVVGAMLLDKECRRDVVGIFQYTFRRCLRKEGDYLQIN